MTNALLISDAVLHQHVDATTNAILKVIADHLKQDLNSESEDEDGADMAENEDEADLAEDDENSDSIELQ